MNQDKISNHNVESDCVNLLLNDVGNTTFYKGYDYGEGGSLENHCPNTFFNFKADGTVQMTVGTRDERMADVDEFLNNYLRTLSPDDKQKTLLMIGELVEAGFNGADINEVFDILLTNNNVEYVAHLAAYLLEYKKEHSELVDHIKEILDGMGMDNISKIVDTVDGITDWKYFDKIMDGLGWLSGHIPGFVYDLLRDYLEKQGISLSEEDLKKLLSMLQTMADDMEQIEIAHNGADIVIPAKPNETQPTEGQPWAFTVQTEKLVTVTSELEKSYNELIDYVVAIKSVCSHLNGDFFGIERSLDLVGKNVLQQATEYKYMKEALEKISTYYQVSEEKIVKGGT